ncbi:MAG: alpha/beta fold hydrolase [Bdellovibrionales bacterium]
MSILESIHHRVEGNSQGKRWVFIHGLMGFLSNWKKITSHIEGSGQCLLYDQRGHGRSFKPESGYAPEDYAQDLYELTEALGWDRFYLVGHSMGGRNALVFADLYPEKIEKLVIEDIGPEANPNASLYYENLLGVIPTPFKDRESARQFFQTEFPLVAKTKEPASVLGAFFYANLIETPDGWDWRFSRSGVLQSVAAGRNQDRWREVEKLKVPTLWIRGELSKELSRENFERVLSLNRLIQGVEIAGAGHWIHSEKPNEFVEALRKFVSGF